MVLPQFRNFLATSTRFNRFISVPIFQFSSNFTNSVKHSPLSSPDFSPLISNPQFTSNSIFPTSKASNFHPIFALIFRPKFLSSLSHTPQILILDEPQNPNSENDSLQTQSNSDVEKFYQTIITTINSGKKLENLEKALDLLGTELTTEIVDEILQRFRYEEKLAFRFFTWASYQDRYEHQPHTYNFMIDVLSSTKYKYQQFGVLCEILDQMKRTKKNPIPLDVLITVLRDYTEKHLTHLRKFVKKKRIKMKTPPETDALNILLDSLCKCSLVKEADVILNRVKKRVAPNSETFNILFFGWCRVKNPNRAMKLLEEMINSGHTPDNFTYNCAIDSFCNAGLVKEARELFEFMCTKGSTISSPTAKTYTIMIVNLAKNDLFDESFDLLTQMRQNGCLPDVSTYKELIEGMCLAGKTECAYKVLDEMSKTGFPPDILTYNCFLKVLCNLHKSNEAIDLCDRMIKEGCEPSVHTYNMVISMFFEMNEPDQAIDIWHEMDGRKCDRVADSYALMIDGLIETGRQNEACDLLDKVMDCGIKLSYKKFEVIIERLSAVGDLQRIQRLSDHMRRFYNKAMARRYAVTQKKMRVGLRRR